MLSHYTGIMNAITLRIASLVAPIALLSACAAHQVAFNEADLARYAGSGTGVINGIAFRVSQDNSTWVQTHGSHVKLFPKTPYTDEIVERKYNNREWLARADARLAKYVRRVHSDDDGHFTFAHLPAGEYYVAYHAKWSEKTGGYDENGVPLYNDDDQWIYVHATVKSGCTTTVEGWDQGR